MENWLLYFYYNILVLSQSDTNISYWSNISRKQPKKPQNNYILLYVTLC